MDVSILDEARKNLIEAGLIAYTKPLYQVLSLDPAPHKEPPVPQRSLDKPVPIGEIFRQMREALHD
jgi:hypothetical protein